MKIKSILLSMFLCGLIFILSASGFVFASHDHAGPFDKIPQKPDLPSTNAEDYVQALQYMLVTGDYSLVGDMVGPDGTAFLLPYGIEYTPPGRDNQDDVRNELSSAQGQSSAHCLNYYLYQNGPDGSFIVTFDGFQFEDPKPDTLPYFMFRPNEAGYWELKVMGYEYSSMAGPENCPAIQYEQEKVPTPAATKLPKTATPTPVSGDLLCTPIRGPINDNSDAISCTEFASQIRPDSLCWLRPSNADAQYWNDDASKNGAGIVDVGDTPTVGDIVVFETTCSNVDKDKGHVAIVTQTAQDANGNWSIKVEEANWNNSGKIGNRNNKYIPVDNSCMSFIHKPVTGAENPQIDTNTASNPANPTPAKRNWWQSLLCFLHLSKCN